MKVLKAVWNKLIVVSLPWTEFNFHGQGTKGKKKKYTFGRRKMRGIS
jgi:hypothetical protein